MSLKEVRENGKDLPFTIAMDFDGTLVDDKFPLIGNINKSVWDAAVLAQKDGAKLILWTCRNDDALKQAVDFCAERGLHFDAINDNLDEVKILYSGNTRKVFADIYVDDRAALLNPNAGFTRVNPPRLEVARDLAEWELD